MLERTLCCLLRSGNSLCTQLTHNKHFIYLGQFLTGSRKVIISHKNSSTSINTHCTQLLVRSLNGLTSVN